MARTTRRRRLRAAAHTCRGTGSLRAIAPRIERQRERRVGRGQDEIAPRSPVRSARRSRPSRRSSSPSGNVTERVNTSPATSRAMTSRGLAAGKAVLPGLQPPIRAGQPRGQPERPRVRNHAGRDESIGDARHARARRQFDEDLRALERPVGRHDSLPPPQRQAGASSASTTPVVTRRPNRPRHSGHRAFRRGGDAIVKIVLENHGGGRGVESGPCGGASPFHSRTNAASASWLDNRSSCRCTSRRGEPRERLAQNRAPAATGRCRRRSGGAAIQRRWRRHPAASSSPSAEPRFSTSATARADAAGVGPASMVRHGRASTAE